MTDEEKDNMAVHVFIEEMKARTPDFALTMKRRLEDKRQQGKSGWDNPEICSIPHLSMLLRRSVEKGDPVNVANLAMMISLRGGTITQGVHDEYTVAVAERLAAPADNPIPPGICYHEDTQSFYATETDLRVIGSDFHADWFSRRAEFPRRGYTGNTRGPKVDG